MFDSFKLSTSHMILLGLVLLILVISLFGYLEVSKIQSRLESISYQIKKDRETCSEMCPMYSMPGMSDMPSHKREILEEVLEPREFEENTPKDIPISNEKPPKSENIKIKKETEFFNLTESQQEFSSEVPEDQSAFSLGAIYDGLDATGTIQASSQKEDTLDKIGDDSEYGSEGSFTDESEDSEESEDTPAFTQEDLEKNTLPILRNLCLENNISKNGNKPQLIKKLLKL